MAFQVKQKKSKKEKDDNHYEEKWKFSKSAFYINPNMEGWFMSWKKGKDEVEIIRYYDDDNDKCGGFEVWYQEERIDGDSWEGDHLATFKSEEKAKKFAEKYIKDNW